jgi:Uma2 family endonuclease
VEPDLLFIAKCNLAIVQDWVRGTPDLVVEVLSPDGGERDRFAKRSLYAANGVREYWIVDADAKTIDVFTLRGDTYEPNGYFEVGDLLVSPLLAELKFPVADVFVDPLSDEK